MAKVSVLIPSRNELFLRKTIEDVLSKARGEVEIIAVLDGYWPDPPLPDHKNLKLIHRSEPRGMRDGINSAAAIAKGEYLFKCDAHCMFSEGFDEILKADYLEDNWLLIMRRLSLDAVNWVINEKEAIDYEHYFYPFLHPDDLGLHARPWMQRARERKDILLDEDASWQGSFWFTSAEHFRERIGGLTEVGWRTFMAEPQELGLKTQLGPWEGKIMRTKRAWGAHLHKGHSQWKVDEAMSGRISASERSQCNAYAFDYFWRNRWEGRAHDIEWLIDRFMPMPGWPLDWRELKAGPHA